MSTSGIDISSLNDEQQAALQQYTSVTDQDVDAAISLLSKCQWNVQIAITRFFDGDAGVIDPQAEASRAAAGPVPLPPPPMQDRRAENLANTLARSGRMSRHNASGLEAAPRVTATSESQLSQPMPFPFNVVLLPFNLAYVILQKILGTLGYLFPFIPRWIARFWSGRASQPTRDVGRKPLSPRDTAARFAREFEEEYGSSVARLPFFQGGYAQAFDVAKRDLKFLLVVLVSPEHDDTAPYVQETLLSEEFINFVRSPDSNIILWGGTVQDAEAYSVAGALHATKFPFASLIVHTPAVSSTAMSKIATASGIITAQELISKLQTAMSTHSAELESVRRQRAEQQAVRNIRQEQESAYERSLAQDREKARRRKAEEAAVAQREKDEQERALQKAEAARKLARWRRWRAQNLPSEPETSDKDAIRISIRLRSGERLVRRFSPDAKLEELYAYVECHDLLNEQTAVEAEKHATEPDDYQHTFKFRIVSPMPREVYDVNKGGSLRQNIGRSGNLIVEPLLDEDDEDNNDMDDLTDDH